MAGFKSPLARKSAVALTVIGSALGGLLSSAKTAKAQDYSNCVSATCTRYADADAIALNQERARINQQYDLIQKQNAQKNSAPAQNNSIDQKYMVQAQVLFATNPDGSYKNPVANAAVKLYADAVSHGFASNPGLYKPFESYFDGLTPQNKDVFIAAFLPKYSSVVFNNSAYNSVDTYAGNMQDAKNSGKSSILELLKHGLTQPPSSDASINQQRQMFRVMLHQPLPNHNVALVVKKPPGPGGQ
jgi:hypothetical protein